MRHWLEARMETQHMAKVFLAQVGVAMGLLGGILIAYGFAMTWMHGM